MSAQTILLTYLFVTSVIAPPAVAASICKRDLVVRNAIMKDWRVDDCNELSDGDLNSAILTLEELPDGSGADTINKAEKRNFSRFETVFNLTLVGFRGVKITAKFLSLFPELQTLRLEDSEIEFSPGALKDHLKLFKFELGRGRVSGFNMQMVCRRKQFGSLSINLYDIEQLGHDPLSHCGHMQLGEFEIVGDDKSPMPLDLLHDVLPFGIFQLTNFRIADLQPEHLAEIGNLSNFGIIDNTITELDASFLTHFTNLSELTIGGKNLVRIPPGTFIEAKGMLRNLTLAPNSPFTEITPESFQGVIKVHGLPRDFGVDPDQTDWAPL